MSRKKLGWKTLFAIEEMYKAEYGGRKKFSNAQIADQFGISVARLNSIIDRFGLQDKEVRNNKIINAVKNGHGIMSVAARFNLSESSIRRIIKHGKKESI